MTEPSLAEQSIELVRSWIVRRDASQRRTDPSAARLAHLLKDPDGLDFTIGFVDRVMRPDDTSVAARYLRALSRRTPAFLPWWQRLLLKVGAVVSFVLPGLVVATARRTLRHMVGHLLVDARPETLGKAIAKLQARGNRLNLNLLGEAVLGDAEASRRRDGTLELLSRDDVDYVSVKVSSVASQLSAWAFEESVDRVVKQLTPLYEKASHGAPTFINLDMEEYHDLDLTVEVFTTVLEGFPDLEAGIVLQAYLPDSLGAMHRLQEWATQRRAAGGAPIKVRIVKGANLAMERVDATMHGWPLATWSSKTETDTHYKRLLHWAMTPERVDAVHLGIAGQNLFDVAHAWLLAGERGVRDAVEFEMLLGMDSGPTAAVRDTVGQLLLYTPVVRPHEFDAAISYLVRRLEENASTDNFMSAAFELADDRTLFDREARRFLDSMAALDDEVPASHRVQDRRLPSVPAPDTGFSNTPDTDPSIDGNRAWGRVVLSRSAYTQLGVETVREARVHGPASLETLVQQTRTAGAAWAARGTELRSWMLHQCGNALEARRGDLVSVMAAETGKTIAEADVEVSEAIDFAHYYAESARRLDAVDGATFIPSRLVVVTPPWNFPVAIPAGSVLAALASGSGVIIKPAPQSQRCAAVMVEALWQAGIPREVLRFATIEEGPLSRDLVTHPGVDRVLLTGGWDTAQLFRSWRPDLPLMAETSGKNAIVVTPSADVDHAVADLVKSAFGHAGQKCSAASLVILVGSMGSSERFERQLLDAVRSLRVGYPHDPDVTMGPLVEAPRDTLLEGLTQLEPGEEWLVTPRLLDTTGRLWSPGVRRGVQPGSRFHLTEYFGPVLGIMHASSLAQAIEWQNAVEYGLTAGLHSLDPAEVDEWIERVEAGNLYVNRGITGAIVQRQPFGGWKRSSVGATAKAGGPNYLAHLGSWTPRPLRRSADVDVLDPDVLALVSWAEQLVPADNRVDMRALFQAAATSDQIAWDREFGAHKDVAGLVVERNVLRYRPVPVTVRCGPGATPFAIGRVLLAAVRSGAPVSVSSARELPAGLPFAVTVESHDTWLRRMRDELPSRVRLVGADAAELADAVDGHPDVAIHAGEVTLAGRVELLPFVVEQAISLTTHRYGNHDAAFDQVLPRPS